MVTPRDNKTLGFSHLFSPLPVSPTSLFQSMSSLLRRDLHSELKCSGRPPGFCFQNPLAEVRFPPAPTSGSIRKHTWTTGSVFGSAVTAADWAQYLLTP